MEQEKSKETTPRAETAGERLERKLREMGFKVEYVDKTGIRSQATSIKPSKPTQKSLTAQEKLEKVRTETGWKVKSVDKTGICSQATSLEHERSNPGITMEQLKQKVKTLVRNEKLAKAILMDIQEHPKEYEKYLTMSYPVQEILTDWY